MRFPRIPREDGLFIGLLFFSPLALGSVHTWAYCLIAIVALLIFDLRRDANGTFALMRKVIPRNVMKVAPENSCPDSHGLVIRPANNAARKEEQNTAHDPYSLTIGTFMCSII